MVETSSGPSPWAPLTEAQKIEAMTPLVEKCLKLMETLGVKSLLIYRDARGGDDAAMSLFSDPQGERSGSR